MDVQAAETLLKTGKYVKKDCWLTPMHVRYDAGKFRIMEPSSLNTGGVGLGVFKVYDKLGDIPYAGNWVECDERGNRTCQKKN